MDLAEICRVMGRRWYVLLPGLLLSAILVVAAYTRLPVTYRSQSTVALLNSEKATQAFDGNPFLSTQTSLTGMADMLARNLDSDASVAALHALGASGTPAAKIADNAQGPLLWLTVSGTDQQAVLRSDRLLTDYAAQRLRELQTAQSVASPARIRMVTIVPPQAPVAQLKTRYEYLALVGIAGVVLTLLVTFYVEARWRRPAEDFDYEPDDPDDPDAAPAPAPEPDAARAGEPYLAPLPGAIRADRAGAGGRPEPDARTAARDRGVPLGRSVHDRTAPRWSADAPGGPYSTHDGAPYDGGPTPGADRSGADRTGVNPDGANRSGATGDGTHRFV